MLDKMQIWAIFLFKFQMGHKAVETTGPGTANEGTVQWWFRKFGKGNESLEEEECSGWPLKFDSDQLRGSSKLILLQLLEKLPKNSALTILWSFGI